MIPFADQHPAVIGRVRCRLPSATRSAAVYWAFTTEVMAIVGQEIPGSVDTPGSSPGRQTRPAWVPSDDFDYQPLRIDAAVSRSAAATMLAIRAEFSGWELARVLRFADGSRRVWLRRRRSAGLLPDLTP